jgi:membrane-associated phospholipid phosphatase
MKYCFIFFIFLALSGVNALAQTLETKWLHSINNQSSLKGSSKFISNSTAFVVVGVPFALLAEAYIDKNESGAEKGWYVASSVALSGITALVMKGCIKRDRPYATYPGYIVPETVESNSSFPSFHTSVAFSLATSLSISHPKWYVIAPSMLWATSVAYSRMNLGVHYPSDVAAGAVLGAGSAWLTYKMNQWLHQPIKRVTKRSIDWLH